MPDLPLPHTYVPLGAINPMTGKHVLRPPHHTQDEQDKIRKLRNQLKAPDCDRAAVCAELHALLMGAARRNNPERLK
jgi:hypothetical protein